MAADYKALRQRFLKAAASYPEAYEDRPWGEIVYKVKGKVFVFCGVPQEKNLSFSVKLPQSSGAALMMPFAEPTAYGLGKAGWITATLSPKDKVPEALLLEWLDESYRAVAPKKLLKLLDVPAETPPVRPEAAKKKRPAKQKAAAPRGKRS
jgi:predicted DNA-binding protein (MmcQ/YjbR family)